MQAVAKQPGLVRWSRFTEAPFGAATRVRGRSPWQDRGAVSRSTTLNHNNRVRAHSDANTDAVDPFVDASVRLQRLIANVGDGEEELMNNILLEESADKKLQLYALFGGLITTTAFGVCWLCGTDPWGGASLSLHSLQSAALGALMVAPLAALRAWSWSPSACNAFPAISDMHDAHVESSGPWLVGLNSQHLLALMSLEILPLIFLLLPAAQGGINASIGLSNELMKSVIGLTIPDNVGMGGALLVTAILAGAAKSIEISVEEEQYEVVKTAVANADRYYRVMSTNMNSSAVDASRAAMAFKAVALSWVTSKEDAMQLAGLQAFVDTVVLGLIWRVTGDLSAAAVAAMLLYSVDYHNLHQRVNASKAGANLTSGGKSEPGNKKSESST